MSSKFYGFKTFELINLDNEQNQFICFCQDTTYGFRHLCTFKIYGIEKTVKCCYYNRTWERFTYESVLLKAAECFSNEEKEFFRKQIKYLH